MPIKMDTDAVRSLASSLQNFSTSYENRLRAIKQSAESANWQSQAREEFIQDLNLVAKGGTLSVEALRLMSRATNRKVDQWEAIGNVFNGPFYFLEGIWDSFRNYLGNSWNNLLKTMGSIRWPTATAITGITTGIVGAFTGLRPKWDFKKPEDWWSSFRKGGIDTSKESVEEITHSTGNINQNGVADDKNVSYPVPPNEIKLQATNEQRSCARYAAARRPDLGSTQSNNEKYADGAAANYISKYEDSVFQISDNNKGELDQVIGKGYAIVWEPGHNSDSTYGHVGIVEEVHSDYIIYSEATRVPPKTGPYVIKQTKISFDQLNHNQVWLIP